MVWSSCVVFLRCRPFKAEVLFVRQIWSCIAVCSINRGIEDPGSVPLPVQLRLRPRRSDDDDDASR